MTMPTYTMGTHQGSATNTTTYSPTTPPGSGGVIIWGVAIDGNRVTSGAAGWTKLGNFSFAAAVSFAVYAKDSTGSDSFSITVPSGEQFSSAWIRVQGVSLSDIVYNSQPGTSSANSVSPGVYDDAIRDGLAVMFLFTDANVVPSAPPTGFSDWLPQIAAGTGGASTSIAVQQRSSNGCSFGEWTVAAEQHIGITLWCPSNETTLTSNPSVVGQFGSVSVKNARNSAIDWFSPTGMLLLDASTGSFGGSSSQQADTLAFTSWSGADLPSGVAVTGARVSHWTSTASTATNYRCYVDIARLLNGSTSIGSDFAPGSGQINSSSVLVTYLFGSSSNLSADSLTDTHINASDFGIEIGWGHSSGLWGLNIDFVDLEIFYSAGGEPEPTLKGRRVVFWL